MAATFKLKVKEMVLRKQYGGICVYTAIRPDNKVFTVLSTNPDLKDYKELIGMIVDDPTSKQVNYFFIHEG